MDEKRRRPSERELARPFGIRLAGVAVGPDTRLLLLFLTHREEAIQPIRASNWRTLQ
jgi:hypothetical protein